MTQPRLFFLPTFREYEQATWQPAVDVYRYRGGWLLKCDLAGVRPQDIRVSVSGRRLTIAGTRRDFFVGAQAQVYSMEITYDHFERTIELPTELERSELRMEYESGMLLIHLIPEGTNG